MVETKRSRKRLFRISLKMTLLIVLFCGAVSGWVGTKRIQSLRQAEAAGAVVELYETQFNDEFVFRQNRYEGRMHPITYDSGPHGKRHAKANRIPIWLRRVIGEECFHSVREVHLAHREVGDEDLIHLQYFLDLVSLNLDDTNVTDKGIRKLGHLTQLERLCLGETGITNDGLAVLKFLTNLSELELWHNDITDLGIEHLGQFKQLKRINLCYTQVTSDGVNRLQSALPECQIWWDGNESFRLINECPTALGWWKPEPNPAALIRAVNHLHSLGKKRAIEALREYTRIAPGEQHGDCNPYCQTRLCLIMPILFEQKDPKKGIPNPFSLHYLFEKAFGVSSPVPVCHEWPMSYVTVEGDIPFHDVRFGGRFGSPRPSRRYLVDWAEGACRLRASPLFPVDDPFDAASNLLEKLRNNEDKPSVGHIESLNEHLLHQAERMVSHLNVGPQSKVLWNKKRQEYGLARD